MSFWTKVGSGLKNVGNNASSGITDLFSMWYGNQQAKKARDYTSYMSNTSYQRAVQDMKSAGLNPILTIGQGGASTPGSPSPQMGPLGTSSSAVKVANENVKNMRELRKQIGFKGELDSMSLELLKDSPELAAEVLGANLFQAVGLSPTVGAGVSGAQELIKQKSVKTNIEKSNAIKRALEGQKKKGRKLYGTKPIRRYRNGKNKK